MSKVQFNIRLDPSQVYEIEKIAKYFNTTPSVVFRNAIDDYFYIFRTWQGRLNTINPDLSKKPVYSINKP